MEIRKRERRTAPPFEKNPQRVDHPKAFFGIKTRPHPSRGRNDWVGCDTTFADDETSESEAVRKHAENDRGVAADGRSANRTESKPAAQKPSSGEVSAARQTGAGKTSTATPQNGENEPHCHPKGASTTCGWHNGAGWLRFWAKEKVKTG